jgi:hypothetical protein
MPRSSVIAAVVVVLGLAAAPSAWAVGGPVILGGDDLTDHGSVDGAGNSEQGWLYMEKAVANIKPQVGRANDNSIAAFGSADPGPVNPGDCCDAGQAIKNAAEKNGMTVQYFDGNADMNTGFANIANGSYNPAIIWIAGTGASNNIDDACSGDGTEGQALIDNAGVINDFVNQGGGLFSHGTCYEWLSSLLPGLSTVDGGGFGDLYLTPEGQSAFPGVSESDFNAGPWHNHFEGNFGGLNLLVRSNQVDDSSGQDAAVVLGGSQVTLIAQPPAAAGPAAPPAAGPAECVRRPISLVRADVRGGRVVLHGLVQPQLAGQQVRILGNSAASKTSALTRLATVRSNSAGQFTARVRRPKGRKNFIRARYRAQVGRFRSIPLKLPQSLTSTSISAQGQQVTIRGKVKRSLLGRRNPVVIKRLVCGVYRTVGRGRPDRNGNYTVTFTVPANVTVALFRAESFVLNKPHGRGRRHVKQYARAISITLTNQTG